MSRLRRNDWPMRAANRTLATQGQHRTVAVRQTQELSWLEGAKMGEGASVTESS